MCQVNANTSGSSTRSTRRWTVDPSVQLTRADPPGRRSIVASLPNQVPSPSAVVSAAHTAPGGWATCTVRSMRSGNAMTASGSSNWLVAIVWQPESCVKNGSWSAELLFQPVEDALTAQAHGERLAVAVRALVSGEPHERLGAGQQVVQPAGLSRPELLVVGVGDQHRTGDPPDDVLGERVGPGGGVEVERRGGAVGPHPPGQHRLEARGQA